jgi:hypothetical protein
LARVSATFQMFCEFVDFRWKLFGRIYGFRICFGNFLEAVRIADILEKLTATCWPEFRLHFRSLCVVALDVFRKLFESISGF